MPVSQNHIEHALDRLSLAGPVSAGRMLGGAGLYLNDIFFGLIADDTLYFKGSRLHYEDVGMPPFKPFGGSYSMSFYRAPSEAIENADNLKGWAEKAVAAAAPKQEGPLKKDLSERDESKQGKKRIKKAPGAFR